MTVNFSADSAHDRRPRIEDAESAGHASGTTMIIQGGDSSTISPNRLAVLLAGIATPSRLAR